MFGDQVEMFNFCCCHGQLAPFPVDGMCAEARKVPSDDTVTIGNEENCPRKHPKLCHLLCHQSSVALYSTDNRREYLFSKQKDDI